MKTKFPLVTLAVVLSAVGPIHAQDPDSSADVVFDVNFDLDSPGNPPRVASPEDVEQRKGGAAVYPLRTPDATALLTETRTATVEESALGLDGRSVVLRFEEAEQPHSGPQVIFQIPNDVSTRATKYRLIFDVAKGDTKQAGGMTLWDVGKVLFDRQGRIRVDRSNTEVRKYEPMQSLHFEITIDTLEKTVTYVIDGDKTNTVTRPWDRPEGRFTMFRLEGLMPGGFAAAPGAIAFDNIRLVVEETH